MKLFEALTLMNPDAQVSILVGSTNNIATVRDILSNPSQNYVVTHISTIFEPEMGDIEPMVQFKIK